MFTKTLLPDTFRAIKLVSRISELSKAYLAGGTALALQIGHHVSVDLDLFTQHLFDEKILAQKLASYPEFVQDGVAKWTVWGKVGKTKFSMFYYKYPMVDMPVIFEGLQLASLKDITAMKIHAIEERGTRRDFIDVYFLSKHFTLSQMLDFYQQKYAVLNDHLFSILRALDYFEDAELEKQMPQMLVPVDWEEVKEFFRIETKRLAKEKLNI